MSAIVFPLWFIWSLCELLSINPVANCIKKKQKKHPLLRVIPTMTCQNFTTLSSPGGELKAWIFCAFLCLFFLLTEVGFGWWNLPICRGSARFLSWHGFYRLHSALHPKHHRKGGESFSSCHEGSGTTYGESLEYRQDLSGKQLWWVDLFLARIEFFSAKRIGNCRSATFCLSSTSFCIPVAALSKMPSKGGR